MPAKTFDDYAADLETRLDAARDACASGSQAKMKAAFADLADFIATSDDALHGVIELDDVASNAMRDVTLARLDQSLVRNLSDRSSDVARLVKTFSTQSADNLSEASKLRLERAKAVVTSAIGFVDQMKQLAASVDAATAEGKKLAQSIEDAIAAVAAVQKKLAG
jgi:hypothetical protein